MNPVVVLPSSADNWTWKNWRRRLLQLTCILVGTMMFYRGLLNLFGYPSEWISLFPGVPILGDICRSPVYWERFALGPIFMGGVVGIVLMWFERRIGWWIFTALNFLVGYWFIFILEDIWQHHVIPHIVFSAVFLPFYPGMKRSKELSSLFSRLLGRVVAPLLKLLQHPWVGPLVVAIGPLHRWINKVLINQIVTQTRARPHPFSTRSSYTSWASLTDKTWAGRHLGVIDSKRTEPLPEWDGANGLKPIFERTDGKQRLCPKSTLLFPAFAQYLTDGFMRTVPEEDPDNPNDTDERRRKRNNSNHEIDMCPLYGRTEEQTRALRVQNPTQKTRGCLRSQTLGPNQEEFPEYLFKDGIEDQSFCELDTPLGLSEIENVMKGDDPKMAAIAAQKRKKLFAVGGDRVNSVPQVSMMNTLWLREHNRLARELGDRYKGWDDDRVFETARNIVIVQFIKIVVEDYINHIAPFSIPLMADPSVAWKAHWNRPNWITTEFSLLYRWHSLIPDNIIWGDASWPVGPLYFMNNEILINNGLKRSFEDMSAQAAAELSPKNTNPHLLHIEWNSIRQGRICELKGYNDYRSYLRRDRARDYEDISTNADVAAALRDAYGPGNVDDVDFFVGIFAEDRVANSPLSQMILSLVALDAFSQALPNPLLSEHVFTAPESSKDHPTFTNYGMEQIGACARLRDIVVRNVKHPERLGFIGMTQAKWQPV